MTSVKQKLLDEVTQAHQAYITARHKLETYVDQEESWLEAHPGTVTGIVVALLVLTMFTLVHSCHG